MSSLSNRGLRLAFGCHARVGKSTAVNYLIDKHGGYEKSFAAPLYHLLHYYQHYCGFKQEKDRQFLQYIGTEWARSKNENVWVDLLLKHVQEYPPETNVYISDVRFPNELKVLKDNGFFTIRIDRDAAEQDKTFGKGDRKHASETSLDGVTDWDYILNNNGSIDEFCSSLDHIVELIISDRV